MEDRRVIFKAYWIDPNDHTRAGEYVTFNHIQRDNYADRRRAIGYEVTTEDKFLGHEFQPNLVSTSFPYEYP